MKLNTFFKVFLLNLFAVSLSSILIAQPGDLSRSFNPSDTCNNEYFTSDYIFVGKVASSISKGSYRVGGSESLFDYKIKIKNEIKGELGESVVITASIISLKDIPRVNEEYIFIAAKNKNKGIKGELISSYWSKPIGGIPNEVLERKIKRISEVTQGKVEPRITGKVILQQPNPGGYYKYQYYDKIFDLGFDPRYSKPLKQIEVIAISESGKKFRTVTDEDGNFKYKKLPKGNYTINLSLPKNYKIMSSHGRNKGSVENYGKPYVGESPCSSTADFAVSPIGMLKGKISTDKGRWNNTPNVTIIAVNPKNNQIYENFGILSNNVQLSSTGKEITFSFKDVPVSRYVISVNSPYKSGYIFFPDTEDGIVKNAICVKYGESVQINYTHFAK